MTSSNSKTVITLAPMNKPKEPPMSPVQKKCTRTCQARKAVFTAGTARLSILLRTVLFRCRLLVTNMSTHANCCEMFSLTPQGSQIVGLLLFNFFVAEFLHEYVHVEKIVPVMWANFVSLRWEERNKWQSRQNQRSVFQTDLKKSVSTLFLSWNDWKADWIFSVALKNLTSMSTSSEAMSTNLSKTCMQMVNVLPRSWLVAEKTSQK